MATDTTEDTTDTTANLKVMRKSNKKTVNWLDTPLTPPTNLTTTAERDPRDAERARATRVAVVTGKLSVNLSTSLLLEEKEAREERDTTTHPSSLSTLNRDAMKYAMDTEERAERDTTDNVVKLSATLSTLLSVILLLTATVRTAVLTHATMVEKEEKVPREVSDAATTAVREEKVEKEDTTTATTAAATPTAASTVLVHGGHKRLMRSLSTTPWYSIFRPKRMFV